MPDLEFPSDFTANRDNIDVNSWQHVYDPLISIQTLLNDTGLDSDNIQQYGLGQDRMRYNGALNGPYIKVYAPLAIPAKSLCCMTGALESGLQQVTTAVSSLLAGSTRYAIAYAFDAIPAAGIGTVATQYEVTGLNTGAAAGWAPVFLSTVAGGLIYALPSPGYRVQMVGFVSNPSTTVGRVQLLLPGHIIPWSIADQVL